MNPLDAEAAAEAVERNDGLSRVQNMLGSTQKIAPGLKRRLMGNGPSKQCLPGAIRVLSTQEESMLTEPKLPY